MLLVSSRAFILIFLGICIGFSQMANAQQAGIIREVYENIAGSSVDDLLTDPNFPDNPASTNLITDFFEAPSDAGSFYGQRMRAFLVPPSTGNYTFWIASVVSKH
jgi:hypothetical protein